MSSFPSEPVYESPAPSPLPQLVFDPATKALRAFYGASDRLSQGRVTASGAPKETVKALIGSPDTDRPQEVYTPEEIRDFLVQFWGAIRLDPCAGPDSILQPEQAYYGRQVETGRTKKNGQPILAWEGAGLVASWTDCTYFNPPYADLEEWLTKAVKEAADGYEIVGLVPVRPQRKWWRQAVLESACAIGWLDPVTFVGYDQSFPAPLVLVYWGPNSHTFKFLFETFKLGGAEVRDGSQV